MIRLEKFFIGILFSVLLSLFLILTTLYFQILNSNYIFGIFEKHGVYEKIAPSLAVSIPNDPNLSTEERFAYSVILKNTTPNMIKEIIETNLGQVLNYAHGKSDDITLSLPTKNMGIAPDDIRWSLSENPNPQVKQQLNILHGIATKILILWAIVFIFLISLYLLYGKITKSNILLGGNRLLITNGLWILISGLITKFSLGQMSKNLPPNPEPSQQLLALLASSVFSEIILGWIIIGAFLFFSGIMLFAINKRETKLGFKFF